jgi:cobalt-zinc-cadmium resistance protein CzcA
MDDLRDTMLTSNNGSPVYVKDVATVSVGNQPRLGIVGQDYSGSEWRDTSRK